jgi:opacity protein-like surface antigen
MIQRKDRMMERMNPRILTLAAVASLGCLGGAAPAFAQGYYQYQYPTDRPVQWFIDGGANITEGQTATNFKNGWTFGTGVNIKPAPGPFMLRLGVDYSYFDASDQLLAQNPSANYGNMQTVTGFVDGMLELPINPWTRMYVMGGPGLGYRGIYLTRGGVYCTPFFCGPSYGSGALVGSDTSTNFAWNAGLGIDFALPGGQSWFVEARYERLETSYAPTEFIPLRVGLRF